LPARGAGWGSDPALGGGGDLRGEPGTGPLRPAEAAPGPHVWPLVCETTRGSAARMSEDRFQLLRLLEAILLSSAGPIEEKVLAQRMPEDADLPGLLQELAGLYANRGVHLMQLEDRWAFRTAPDL